MFTKQHYQEVAELLRDLDVTEETRDALGRLFEHFFSEDNEDFSTDKWWIEIKKDDVTANELVEKLS